MKRKKKKKKKKRFRWVYRRQYFLHMFFKYRRSVRKSSSRALEQLFQWFSANLVVANAGKCHHLTSSKITNNVEISNTNVSSEQKVKLLRANLGSRLNFDYHVNTLLSKAKQIKIPCFSKGMQLHEH